MSLFFGSKVNFKHFSFCPSVKFTSSLNKLNRRGAGPFKKRRRKNEKTYYWLRVSICHYGLPTSSKLRSIIPGYCTWSLTILTISGRPPAVTSSTRASNCSATSLDIILRQCEMFLEHPIKNKPQHYPIDAQESPSQCQHCADSV